MKTDASLNIETNPFFKIINSAKETDDEKARLVAIRWNRVFFRRQSREAYDAFLDYLYRKSMDLASRYSLHARISDDGLRQKFDTGSLQDAQELLKKLKDKKTDWEQDIQKLKDGVAMAEGLRAKYLILGEAEKMFDTPHFREDETESPHNSAVEMATQLHIFKDRIRKMETWLDETIAHGETRVTLLRDEDERQKDGFLRAAFVANLHETGMATSRKVAAPKRARFKLG